MVIMHGEQRIKLADVATLVAPKPANDVTAPTPEPLPVLPPVRFSHLKLMAQSPAHYLANARKETRCMEVGSATDAMILGTKRVIYYPGKTRNGKEWEAFRDADENADALIVTRSEYAEAEAIAASVRADKRAMRVLAGEHQKEIKWRFLGRDCVSHLDVMGKGGAWVTELKVSQSSNPAKFRWQALRMAYHAQLAFYGQAVEALTGQAPRAYFIVCVEATPPHPVTVFKLKPRAIQTGQQMCRLWFERLLQCEAADFWPPYSQSLVDLDTFDEDEGSDGIPF